MTAGALSNWLNRGLADPTASWYLKRLSSNDTQRTGGHQAGPYIPKAVIFRRLPELTESSDDNPRVVVPSTVLPQGTTANTRAIWYNQKTRNEARITGWGGSHSPLLDVTNTGALALFCFRGARDARLLDVWVCSSPEERNIAEGRFGPVEPGPGREYPVPDAAPVRSDCRLSAAEMPPRWLDERPSPATIFQTALQLRPDLRMLPADERFTEREACESQLFESIESAYWTPRIKRGCDSFETFLPMALRVTQSRRSRAGKSLEWHVQQIFDESGLIMGEMYDYQQRTEGKKKPDFLFPSGWAYRDASTPSDNLRMLAVKRTLRERWPQVNSEADRIARKHLLTMDVKISEDKFRQILDANIQLVIPEPVQAEHPTSYRPHFQSLADFIEEVAGLS